MSYHSYHSSSTAKYRGHWIHCAVINRRDVCRIQAPNGDIVGTARSFASAKKKVRARAGLGRAWRRWR